MVLPGCVGCPWHQHFTMCVLSGTLPSCCCSPWPCRGVPAQGGSQPAVLPCGTTSMVCRLGLMRVLARSRCCGAGGWGSGSAPVLPGGMLKEKGPLGGGSGAWSLGSPGANVVISQTKGEHLTGGLCERGCGSAGGCASLAVPRA